MNGIEIRVGDRVRVFVPPHQDIRVDNITVFNNEEMIVSAKVSCKHTFYYHLEGALGKNGQPYAFLKEWLQKI